MVRGTVRGRPHNTVLRSQIPPKNWIFVDPPKTHRPIPRPRAGALTRGGASSQGQGQGCPGPLCRGAKRTMTPHGRRDNAKGLGAGHLLSGGGGEG